jgi:hypothetical protein
MSDISMPKITAPKVTWLIPVLNGMPYLPMTLESIRDQTYSNHQLLVWDNGSTDGTVEELRRWIPDRLAGKIITWQPLPLGNCLARMVEQAETELCARVDADDVNMPDRLEKQVRFMVDHPEVSLVGAQVNRLDSASTDLGLFSDYPLDHDSIVQAMLMTNPLAHPVVLFRKSAILDAGNYRDLSPVEDYDMWLRLAGREHRVANLPASLLKYRVHEKSITQKALLTNRLETLMIKQLCEVSPALFGCDGETMQQLRTRTRSRAIVPLRQIARHLEKTSPGAVDPWRSPIFYQTAKRMIEDRDVRSRIGAAYENRGIFGAISELKTLGKRAIRSAGRRIVSSAK